MKETLLSSFEEYLLDNICEGSTKSYLSYLKNAFKKFGNNIIEQDDLLSVIVNVDNKTKSILVESVISKICDAQKDINSVHNKKTLQNYKSSLNMLSSFLSGLKEEEPVITVKPDFKLINSNYSQKEIIKNFRSRLNTQDRFYSFATLPCRLLNKIFKKNTIYKNLINNIINKTKFIFNFKSGKSFSYQLEEINSLKIIGNTAIFEVNGRYYNVYTEIYRNGASQGYDVAEVMSLANLSLDHDVPIYEVLKNNINRYNELYKISMELIKYRNLHKLTNSKLTTNFYKYIYPSLNVNENKLLMEMKDLYSKLSLSIMQSNYNSSKNKNYTN